MIFNVIATLAMVIVVTATALPDTPNLEKRQNCKALGVRPQRLNTAVEILIITLRTLEYAWIIPVLPATVSASLAIALTPRPTSNAVFLSVASPPRVTESVRTLTKVRKYM